MKTKIFLVISAMLVFGLAVVVYSSATSTDLTTMAASCCCCHGDSCPMKQKSADAKDTASCCDDCDCCGESCPMMKKDANGNPIKMDAKNCPMMMKKDDATASTSAPAAKTDEASCPMKMKDADGKPIKMDNADATGMHNHHMNKDGKSCDCSCCHKAKDTEKKDAAAV